MFKMLLGNVLFLGIMYGWYRYNDGDQSIMISGVVLGFACFISGIFVGYILHPPTKRRSSTASVPSGAGFVHPVEEPEPELETEPEAATEAANEHHVEPELTDEPEVEHHSEPALAVETPPPEVASEIHPPENEPPAGPIVEAAPST